MINSDVAIESQSIKLHECYSKKKKNSSPSFNVQRVPEESKRIFQKSRMIHDTYELQFQNNHF